MIGQILEKEVFRGILSRHAHPIFRYRHHTVIHGLWYSWVVDGSGHDKRFCMREFSTKPPKNTGHCSLTVMAIFKMCGNNGDMPFTRIQLGFLTMQNKQFKLLILYSMFKLIQKKSEYNFGRCQFERTRNNWMRT